MSKWEDDVWNRLFDKVYQGRPKDATVTNEILMQIFATQTHIKKSLKTLEWIVGIVAFMWGYDWVQSLL